MNPAAIIEYVRDYAKTVGGEFNLTKRGVPRIIMTGKDEKISLVFAARSGLWKAFYPYPATEQKREYFKDTKELMRFLSEKGCQLNAHE